MPNIEQDIAAIRGATYGEEVREAIADGIQQCYSDISTSATLADGAAAAANAAATRADASASAAEDIVLVQAEQPTSEANKIWIKPESEEYEVPTWEEFNSLVARVTALEGRL